MNIFDLLYITIGTFVVAAIVFILGTALYYGFMHMARRLNIFGLDNKK